MLLPSYPAAQHTHTIKHTHTQTHSQTHTHSTATHTHKKEAGGREGRLLLTNFALVVTAVIPSSTTHTHTHNQAHTHTYKKGGGWGWRVGGDCYWPVLHSMSLLSYPAAQPLWHMPVLESQGSPPLQLPQVNAQSRPYFMGLHSENVTR